MFFNAILDSEYKSDLFAEILSMGGSLDILNIVPNRVMNYAGHYAVGAQQMYAKEYLCYPNFTPNHYLHEEMHLDTFR